MIEIRTFDGEPAELSSFCTGTWRDRYLGKMPMADWAPPFVEWELFSWGPSSREFLVAAYDGTRLVGALPARRARYQLRGQRIDGTQGSFFGVDPDYESQGVSLKLLLEQRRRQREQGLSLFMGYLITGAHESMGTKFWLKLQSTHLISRAGLWARLIDHRAVADFLFSRRDGWGARILGLFQGPPKPPRHATGIRPYGAADLPDALRIVEKTSARAEFGLVWDESSLARQLCFQGFPRTLIAEQDGKAAGLVNWFYLDLLGRRQVRAAVIDLICLDELPRKRGVDLLKAALCTMADDGCQMALSLRTPIEPRRQLLAAGFMPQLPEYTYMAQRTTPDAPVFETRRLHVVWR
jgi:GNAT superfamily N-acetyltransferase